MKNFNTPKGTEIPIQNIKGKDYILVAHRLVWFREEHPDWGIETEIISHDEQRSLMRATIRNSEGRTISQATKQEDVGGFGDHLEKAETGAIGRALALAGYGTQFAPDLDESERVVDAPLAAQPAPMAAPRAVIADPAAAAYVLRFGKFSGKRLDQVDLYALNDYFTWLKGNQKPGQDDTAIRTMEAYLKTREVRPQQEKQ